MNNLEFHSFLIHIRRDIRMGETQKALLEIEEMIQKVEKLPFFPIRVEIVK
jgi:hypothetical protein